MKKSFFNFPRVKKNKALTLIEVLLVVSLVSLISIAIYKSLSSGIKLWQKAQDLVVEEDIAVFFDKITSDLRNTFYYSKLDFYGENYKLSFPTIVHTLKDKRLNPSNDQYCDQIGKVEYYFDVVKNELYRRQANYSQSLYENFGPSQKLIHSVKSVEFRYLYINKEGEILSEKILEKVPLGVEISVKFLEFGKEIIVTKYVNIPIGV